MLQLPLAWAFIGAYRIQDAVIGVGATVTGDFDLTDEHAPAKYQRGESESTHCSYQNVAPCEL